MIRIELDATLYRQDRMRDAQQVVNARQAMEFASMKLCKQVRSLSDRLFGRAGTCRDIDLIRPTATLCCGA